MNDFDDKYGIIKKSTRRAATSSNSSAAPFVRNMNRRELGNQPEAFGAQMRHAARTGRSIADGTWALPRYFHQVAHALVLFGEAMSTFGIVPNDATAEKSSRYHTEGAHW